VRNSSGFAVAALVVFLFYESYFSRDLLPPVDRVFAATIEAGADLLFLTGSPPTGRPGLRCNDRGGR
jgi:hypothetical protein